jgi:26S proteasome regulatory subunit N1
MSAGMGLAGLLAVLVAGMDIKATLGGKQHYLLYALATAARPRMFMTLDEDGAHKRVFVHVC